MDLAYIRMQLVYLISSGALLREQVTYVLSLSVFTLFCYFIFTEKTSNGSASSSAISGNAETLHPPPLDTG